MEGMIIAPANDTESDKKLAKSLKLFDVYAVATGAMFSSGLFLLPGIAAAQTGNSVYLAYMVAGFLILPAMVCMAELSTAMPRSGGAYFFLDRSMGPMMGMIGGVGSWIATVFKSAFALVGMGAYLALYIDLPITITAVVLTIAFGVLNVLGAKETTLLQRILVGTLVIILTAFIVVGLSRTGVSDVFSPDPAYGAFFREGFGGFITTIGLVFVSYAGLTKVASVSEEIENPDRNIPLGMVLSLITATSIYTLGALLIVTALPPDELFDSLTPVADAGEVFLGWIPYDLGIALLVVAAVAAFASTGNAGILSASRYPFAMAKDKLVHAKLGELGRGGTPVIAIGVTVLTMVLVLLVFDVESVAKLASAFQLLLFGLLCLAVIVMRESQIDSYRPGYRVPLYPWTPIAGFLLSFWLILEMGAVSILFTAALAIACGVYFQSYASKRVKRRGAIYHMHRHLGHHTYEGIEHELTSIVHEKTQPENLRYESLIGRAAFVDYGEGRFDSARLSRELSEIAQKEFGLDEKVAQSIFEGDRMDVRAIRPNMYLAYKIIPDIDESQLAIFRFSGSATVAVTGARKVHTLMYLLLPEEPVGLDLRIVGHLAEVAQSDNFEERWLAATQREEINRILARDDHVFRNEVSRIPVLAAQKGARLEEIKWPGTCLIMTVERDGELIIARPDLQLRETDIVSVLGEPEDLGLLYDVSSIE
ncbi:amino acid permease [Erythrobacter sp.]|uniref:amino acid permease n=1 Tax=Erythrobacter sp. TaxID=1042 RepID=UPI001B239F26|nr:amino acid permease [Erythrobacter sp.]MBO6525934.1 amino acid permease [Erythrobacter sp.]MBO6529391.1 amino acid permease [Erythrobacter sp.]